MKSNNQLELPLSPSPARPASGAQHLDFPLQRPAPYTTPFELRRLDSRWGGRQTLHSLRRHGLR